MIAVTLENPSDSDVAVQLDALVIGAGVSGLYQLYRLREQGLNVKIVDAASDVGGTWHWNRYPGARLDSHAYAYQYLFSEDLYAGWSWSERFAAQPEVERWLHYVADRLDLRKDIKFGTSVLSASFDDQNGRWTVTTDGGARFETRFLISCSGMLSAPLSPAFAGQDVFTGEIFHTARWPKEQVDFKGKRVGVVGTGGDRNTGHSSDRRRGRTTDRLHENTSIYDTDQESQIHIR